MGVYSYKGSKYKIRNLSILWKSNSQYCNIFIFGVNNVCTENVNDHTSVNYKSVCINLLIL